MSASCAPVDDLAAMACRVQLPPFSCARASVRDPNDDVDDAAVRRPEPFSLPAARDGQHATVKGFLRGRQPLGGAFGHLRGQLDQVMKAGRPGGRDADPAGRHGWPTPLGEDPDHVVDPPQLLASADETVMD